MSLFLFQIVLFGTPLGAVAAFIGAAVLAYRAAILLPADDHEYRRLRALVVLHLLEPWVTLPWIVVIYRSPLTEHGSGTARMFTINPLAGALLVTLPMLLLVLPWAQRPWTVIGGAALAQHLRLYGSLRYGLTFMMWWAAGSSTFYLLPFGIVGTVNAWFNVVHVRRAFATIRHALVHQA